MIDFYASQPQYVSHLAPLYNALAPEERGDFYVGLNRNELAPSGERERVLLISGRPSNAEAEPVVVAAAADLWACQSRPAVLLEHGSGQAYEAHRSPSYSGGPGREHVALFLCTNEMVAARNRLVYPKIESFVCGSPRLDRLVSMSYGLAPADDLVGFTFHWDYAGVPEARSTWPYWRDALPGIAASYSTWGHAHPKIARQIMPLYPQLGIQPVEDYNMMLVGPSVLCADNTSALYERAALDAPVVVLNAPWYRRNVEHGLRFWSHADVGIQVDHPDELLAAIDVALVDPSSIRERRREIAAEVYPHVGQATKLAVDAIRAVESRPHRSQIKRRTA